MSDSVINARGILKHELQELGYNLSEEEIDDFQLTGEESDSKLVEIANDYVRDIRTDEAEYRHHKKHGDFQ